MRLRHETKCSGKVQLVPQGCLDMAYINVSASPGNLPLHRAELTHCLNITLGVQKGTPTNPNVWRPENALLVINC